MTDRFRPATEGRRRSLWRKIVDLSLTDVSVLVNGIDEDAIEDLERVLLEADFGVESTLELIEALEGAARRGSVRTEDDLRRLLRAEIRGMLEVGAGPRAPRLVPEPERAAMRVILLVGVNGTGKTTTAARLAHRALAHGQTALLAATDTFRSGAQEQLRLWAERLGAQFVGGKPGGDPAAVAWDAAEAAKARAIDVLIVDTAGRLHTAAGLMDELRKIDRVLDRVLPDAALERLLVVDATSGQNVVTQARQFGEALALDGLVLTKFDSSARGGAVVAVARALGLPVRWVGTGESADALEAFDADRYVEKLLAET